LLMIPYGLLYTSLLVLQLLQLVVAFFRFLL